MQRHNQSPALPVIGVAGRRVFFLKKCGVLRQLDLKVQHCRMHYSDYLREQAAAFAGKFFQNFSLS
jgi:hypothetical protein